MVDVVQGDAGHRIVEPPAEVQSGRALQRRQLRIQIRAAVPIGVFKIVLKIDKEHAQHAAQQRK